MHGNIHHTDIAGRQPALQHGPVLKNTNTSAAYYPAITTARVLPESALPQLCQQESVFPVQPAVTAAVSGQVR